MNRDVWREHAVAIARMCVAAIITTSFIILGIQLVFGAQAAAERQTAEDLLASNRAVICVLAVPVSDKGRDEATVNSVCLVPNHQLAFDMDGDGFIEYAGRKEAESA